MIFDRFYTIQCKRCGKIKDGILSKDNWAYKIGTDFFCSYTCHLHEVTEREEAKRKREEEALERKRLRQKARNIQRYRFDKNNMEPYHERKTSDRPVLKCRADTGEIVKRFPTLLAGAEDAGIASSTLRKWISGNVKRKMEFVWRYEDS